MGAPVRLKVVRAITEGGKRGWRWICVAGHPRPVTGFTPDRCFTDYARPGKRPPPQQRAMDGARLHLHRFHERVSR